MHNTHIQEAIIALRIPGKSEQTSIKLRVTDDNLQGMCFLYMSINIKSSPKALEAQAQPNACEEIAQDAETFHRFFLDCIRYCSTEADAGHKQKIAIVDTAKVNSARLTIDEDIAGTCNIHWNTRFMCPNIEGATGNETQSRFTSGQFLND